MDAGPPKMKASVVARIVLGAFIIVATICLRPAVNHAVAAGVLLRLSETGDTMGLREFHVVPYTRRVLTLPLPEGSPAPTGRAYRYEPESRGPVMGMVLVHGVHYKGIDEPRLVRFAESLAQVGVTVLTPEIPSLADYRIDQSAVVEIGVAARSLHDELGGDVQVGVLGISFSGSLALLAADDPVLGKDVGFVVTVGSYDDLARVCRFYATGTIERPDGSQVSLSPHEYGPVVWIYSHLEDFFPPDGLEDVRASLRFWLHEERDKAREALPAIHEESRRKLEVIYSGDLTSLDADMKADVDRHAAELAALSPHGHMDKVTVPIFVLHGSDDHLIPPSETLWLAHDLPPGKLAMALITGALTHVEIGERSSFAEKLQTVHFMAGVLAAAHRPN
jgi:dienelactone hydrolase